MLYYDFKKFTLSNINTISQIIKLLNKSELKTFIKFLYYSNKIQQKYFITQKHFKKLYYKYKNFLKLNTSHYLIINYISNSLKKSNNQIYLFNILVQLHINNKTLLQLLTNLKSHLQKTLVS